MKYLVVVLGLILGSSVYAQQGNPVPSQEYVQESAEAISSAVYDVCQWIGSMFGSDSTKTVEMKADSTTVVVDCSKVNSTDDTNEEGENGGHNTHVTYNIHMYGRK